MDLPPPLPAVPLISTDGLAAADQALTLLSFTIVALATFPAQSIHGKDKTNKWSKQLCPLTGPTTSTASPALPATALSANHLPMVTSLEATNTAKVCIGHKKVLLPHPLNGTETETDCALAFYTTCTKLDTAYWDVSHCALFVALSDTP